MAQRGLLFCWVPVCLGLGISIYFQLLAEPSSVIWILICIAVCGFVVAGRLLSYAWRPVGYGAALVLVGVIAAGVRTASVAQPVLTFRYYGPIEGRIIGIDRSAADAVRLTLDRVVLNRMAPSRTPAHVRVSLHGDQRWLSPEPGMVVILTGHLSPPSGPVEPGGFDFRRNAWFDRLGGVGYTRTPVLLLQPAEDGAGLWIHRLRATLSHHISAAIDGQAGAFAAAILTGDRSGIALKTTDDLRRTNLAHLLAISGLHMGLLTGSVFAALRLALVSVSWVGLRWPVRKIAATAALAVGAGYLALSGGNVATVRAYVMVAVMLIAVLLDRRALTLRAVAIAATLILTVLPEEVLGPGFQMSFAATVALVAVFGVARGVEGPIPAALRPVATVGLSSLVAGFATAPVAAAHFGMVSHYGLVANLLSVPVVGIVVMPAALLAAVLWPVGLSDVGFWVMGLGLNWILGVAETVAGWQGAVSLVPVAPKGFLGLMAFGGLLIVLWQGRGRWLGLPVLLVSASIWLASERPPLLISDSGRLMGLLTERGRALSRSRGDGFAAGSWLEDDGDPATQADAAQRAGLNRRGQVTSVEIGGTVVVMATGQRGLAGLTECGGGEVLITDQVVTTDLPCTVYDQERLRQSGSLAIYPGLVIVTAQDLAGVRPWTGRQP